MRGILCIYPGEQTHLFNQSFGLNEFSPGNITFPIKPLREHVHRCVDEALFDFLFAPGNVRIEAGAILPEQDGCDPLTGSWLVTEGESGHTQGMLAACTTSALDRTDALLHSLAFCGHTCQLRTDLLIGTGHR